MDGEAKTITLLRQLTRRRESQEHCELCSVAVAPEHRHLLEVATGGLVCACDACALRFHGVIGGRFKLVPRDSRWLRDFQITDQDWQMLGLPIKLGFLFENTRAKHLSAIYPSPGGPTESVVSDESWDALCLKNAVLRSLESDVEALLVNRVGEARDYFTAPIDVCYALVGLVRMHWRGLSGGDEVWRQLEGFFTRLKASADIVESKQPERVHA